MKPPPTYARPLSLLVTTCALAVSSVSAQQWPSFRGPNGGGVASATAAPPVSFDVPAGRNVAWRTPVPGLAHSSPIVWNDRVFVTTTVASSGSPSVKTGAPGIDPADDLVSHTWRLLALDAKTGRVAWDREVHKGVPRLKRHVKASHASATPATNGRVIVALLGSEGLFCFDMNGVLEWKQDLGVMDVGLVDDPTYQWGPASSPIIHDNLVIVQNDRHKDSFLAAYDLATGRRVWQATRDELPSWATPIVVRSGARAELVTNSGKFIRGYDPATGNELWRFSDNATQVKVPSPVAAGGTVIVTGGYPGGGRPIYAFRPNLSGTVTESTALAWKADRGSPYTPTPLVYDGLLYVCTDNGIFSAYDIKTGERVYQHRLSPRAGAFSASPVAAAGRIYLTSEDGDLFVVRAGRTFELLSTNSLGEIAMATPAIAGDALIVRTRSQVVALRETRADHASSGILNRALGVECTHCHVADRWNDPAKPAFATARKMMAMVNVVNEKLEGVGRVECVTCHGGGLRPERSPRPALDAELARWPASAPDASDTVKITMAVYNVALGVDCTHCHVGDWKNGEKATFKKVALMSSLFQEFPKYMPPTARTQCYMCHKGSTRPKISGDGR